MSAQQQVQPRPPQLQQQPWWSGPVSGIGSALQGMQHNLQQLANNLPKVPGHQHPQQQQQSVLGTSAARPGSYSAQQQGDSHRPSQLGQHLATSLSSKAVAFPAAAAAAAAAAAGGPPSRATKYQQQQQQAVTKEELGRATWVFLHTLAAQFPEHPSRQQQRDARQLMDCFTRIYPCADCAQHFQEIVKRDPPDVSSGPSFSQWMCRAHNAVNRRLGKPSFNCDLVGARWAPLDCNEHNSCDMTVGRPR